MTEKPKDWQAAWEQVNAGIPARTIMKEHKLNPSEVAALKDEIGIGLKHANYEDIIKRAEKLMAKYGKSTTSAHVIV